MSNQPPVAPDGTASPAEAVAEQTGAVTSSTPTRLPRSYLPTATAASFGVYTALLTPALVTIALRVNELDPEGKAGSYSLISALGGVAALIGNPLIGRLSDRTTSRFGMRRPWILGGVVVGVLALALMGFAPSIAVLAVGWVITQFAMNAVIAGINATIPDQVPLSRRGLTSGLINVASPTAILVGVLLVSNLGTPLLQFLLPGLVALVLVLVFVAMLHDRVRNAAPEGRFTVKEFAGAFVFNVRKHPNFGWAWLTKFLIFFGYAGTNTYLTYFLIDHLHYSPAQVGGVVAAATIASTVTMLLASSIGGWISDRSGGRRRPFAAVSGILLAAGLLGMAFAPNLTVVIIAQLVLGLGLGAFNAIDLALVTQILPDPNNVAKDLGVLNIANTLPKFVGPVIAPLVISLGGYPLWYGFAAVVVLVGASLIFKIKGVK